MTTHLESFRQKGVILHAPAATVLELDPDQIEPGAEIFPGCRISGRDTRISRGCRIGTEGPVTLIDCQLGQQVTIASGFARQATLLDQVSVGANAHIRPGTLLEEQASIAHSVGLKQTVLFPFVTLGSLINFCDCLMAGGTSRANHSEVGSSYVHFNYTPHQDKATPSLIGNVPQGVLLDQAPIFLGGQGGLVGPARINFGTVLAAGTICRRDILTAGMLVQDKHSPHLTERPYQPDRFGNIERIDRNNRIYIGNLHALHAWYYHIRSRTAGTSPFAQACIQAALARIGDMISERIKQIEKLAGILSRSPGQHPSHARGIAGDRSSLVLATPPPPPPAALLQACATAPHLSHIAWVQALAPSDKNSATAWLQSFVDRIHKPGE